MPAEKCAMCPDGKGTRKVLGLWLCLGCFKKNGGRLTEVEQEHAAEIERLAKKAVQMSRDDKEHIEQAGTSEAIKILARSKSNTGRGEKLGTLYYSNGSSIVVYKNPDSLRSLGIFGHGHRKVSIRFEDRHDVLSFARKINRLLGVKVYKGKDGKCKAYLGVEK